MTSLKHQSLGAVINGQTMRAPGNRLHCNINQSDTVTKTTAFRLLAALLICSLSCSLADRAWAAKCASQKVMCRI